MNFSQIDEELLLALDSFPELDIWTDLEKTRSLGKKMRQKIIGQTLPVEGVQHADYVLPQDDAHDLVFRVYRPDSQTDPLPALLWMHGGGYCLGAMENDDSIVRQFVKETGCIMVSVDYRLAPEFPYPIALNDCYAVLSWIADHSEELAIDRLRIAVGGVSAGAGLAASLALYVRDHSDIKLAFQFLLCPMIDDRSVTSSLYQANDAKTLEPGFKPDGVEILFRARKKCRRESGGQYPDLCRRESCNGPWQPPACVYLSGDCRRLYR